MEKVCLVIPSSIGVLDYCIVHQHFSNNGRVRLVGYMRDTDILDVANILSGDKTPPQGVLM